MDCINPRWLSHEDEPVIVACGKCLSCLHNLRKDWCFRLRQEWKHSTGAMFVTLTYGDRQVPEDGLCKRDVQLFMKKLRKRCGGRLRYFCTGEYGSKKGRPHYHLLLFNVRIVTGKQT